MNNSLIKDHIFNELKFTKEWIDIGIVNSENFTYLKERYLKGEDTSTEHYRWEAFVKFIKENKENLTQEIIHKTYCLAKDDPDIAMGRSMIFRILDLDNCPDELIDLATKDEYKGLSKHAFKIRERRSKKL